VPVFPSNVSEDFATLKRNGGHLVVEDNSGLDGALVLHRLQALAPLLELESLVDNALNLDFA
jgi:hypothetical protein